MTPDAHPSDPPPTAAPAVTPRQPRRARRPVALAALAAVMLMLAMAGCSGSAADVSGSMAQQMPDSTDAGARAATTEEMAAGDGLAEDLGGADEVMAPGVQQQSAYLIRRADLALRVDDVDAAAAAVRQTVTSVQGQIASEYLSGQDAAVDGPEGSDYATFSARVPTERLDEAVDRLAEIGEVLSRSSSSDDVEAQYVDLDARVRSLTESLDRLRAFMDQTQSITDVVTLESEISRRQADLDALTAQLDSLTDRIAMSTVDVRMTTEPEYGGAATGFVAGLRAGWEAFTTSLRVLVTVIGGVLPFAAAGLLVVIPLLWWWRRRHSARPTPTSPTDQTSPTPSARASASSGPAADTSDTSEG